MTRNECFWLIKYFGRRPAGPGGSGAPSLSDSRERNKIMENNFILFSNHTLTHTDTDTRTQTDTHAHTTPVCTPHTTHAHTAHHTDTHRHTAHHTDRVHASTFRCIHTERLHTPHTTRAHPLVHGGQSDICVYTQTHIDT